MIEGIALMAVLRGCDATHRANNSETHLTHGCIPLFRHFWRVRRECADLADGRTGAFARFFESAPRTLTEVAL